MNPTSQERSMCCNRCAFTPYKGQSAPELPSGHSCAVCPCHQPSPAVEGWQREFDELTMFLEVRAEHGPQPLIIEPEDRGKIKSFISSLIEKVRQERDAFWQEQEMGVSRDCAKHSEEAHKDGIQEGKKMERERILADLDVRELKKSDRLKIKAIRALVKGTSPITNPSHPSV